MNFINSWKTTLCGLAAGVFTILSNTSTLQNSGARDWLIAAAKAIGVVAIGLFAKDADKTGKQ